MRLRRTLVLPLLAVLCACGPVQRSAPPVPPATGASALAGVHYHLDPGRSTLRVLVHRAGPLAALGHNHVVRAAAVAGGFTLAADGIGASGELQFEVADLMVDEPDERHAAGVDFEAPVSAEDRAGTLRNLLGPAVLDAPHFPRISVRFHREGGAADTALRATVRVRDTDSDWDVLARPERHGEELRVSGTLLLGQGRLGLTPFSTLLGALRVDDALEVRFDLVARPD